MAVSVMIPKSVTTGPGPQDASTLGVASGTGIAVTVAVLSTVIVFVTVEVLIISIVSVLVAVVLMVGVTTFALVLTACVLGAATSFPVAAILDRGTTRSCGTALKDVFHPVTITVIAPPNKSRHIQARIGRLRPGPGELFKGDKASVQREKLTIGMPNELTAACSIILFPESRVWLGCAVALDAADWIKSASAGATLFSMCGIRILVMYR